MCRPPSCSRYSRSRPTTRNSPLTMSLEHYRGTNQPDASVAPRPRSTGRNRSRRRPDRRGTSRPRLSSSRCCRSSSDPHTSLRPRRRNGRTAVSARTFWPAVVSFPKLFSDPAANTFVWDLIKRFFFLFAKNWQKGNEAPVYRYAAICRLLTLRTRWLVFGGT